MLPSGHRSCTVAPGAARTETGSHSPRGHQTLPLGRIDRVSIQAPLSGATKRRARRTDHVSVAESVAVRATRSKFIMLSGGRATQASQAPLGQTGTGHR